MSACETDIIEFTGCDTEQEQATLGHGRPASEAFPTWDAIRIWAPFVIMGHIPPCMQQPQVQADLHDAADPFTRSEAWKEPHRARANSSVPKNPLITV